MSLGKIPQYFFSQYIGKKDIGDFLAFELLKCGVEATESYGKKSKRFEIQRHNLKKDGFFRKIKTDFKTNMNTERCPTRTKPEPN